MKRLLIVHHSSTGGTLAMAEAAAAGARDQADVETVVKRAPDAGPDDLLAADGYLFATPETLATMAGLMKDLFDRSFYQLLGRLEARPYALLICAGSDGTNAVRQLERIAGGWRLRAVADPVIVLTGVGSPEIILAPKVIADADLARCRDVGGALAAGLSIGMY